MTRPDPAAFAVAGPFAIAAGLFALNRWPWPFAIAGGCAIAAAVLFWHVPLCDENGNGIEALIEATREEHPAYRDWDIRELTP